MALFTVVGMAYVLGFVPVDAQQSNRAADAHLAAARAAAGTSDAGSLFKSLCNVAAPASDDAAPGAGAARGRGRGAAGVAGTAPARGRAAGPPARDTWHAEPVKVFDNLYYVGEKSVSVWAITTSAGIILIDTIFDYSVEDEVVGGLKKLGLNPENIKNIVVSHGHNDHSGGAKYLQERFSAPVFMSAADWDYLYKNPNVPKPTRDKVIADGQKMTLGDTALTFYITPGHTPGTVSTLVPVKDNGQPHLAAEWGGTGFNFPPTPENFRIYAASAKRFADIAVAAGADVLIAPHPERDGGVTKLPAMATRKPGDPHPYVVGTQAVKNYLTVASECAAYRAALPPAPTAAPAR
jgi:metallo-beta-lactamase class B